MKIIDDVIGISEIKEMALNSFGDMVKAIVDIEKEILAVDAELHSDLERLLLENGSKQAVLWGINLYPENAWKDDFIEFDSLINVRPMQNNKNRYVEDENIRKQIVEIVSKKVKL